LYEEQTSKLKFFK